MPFYLYGTPKSLHIDHILLRAPNAHLSATAVELQLNVPLTHIIPAEGSQVPLVTILEDVYEATMQPFGESNEPTIFAPGRTFNVTIYGTNVGSTTTVWDESLGRLATGTLKIGQRVWREFSFLNKDLVPPSKPHANIDDAIPFQLRVEKELMDALKSVSDYEHRARFVYVVSDDDKPVNEDKKKKAGFVTTSLKKTGPIMRRNFVLLFIFSLSFLMLIYSKYHRLYNERSQIFGLLHC